MTKVYPNAAAAAVSATTPATSDGVYERLKDGSAVVLTVWKKSLLLNCYGFTVYDSKGNIVFRVDNYASGSKGEILLMDAAGKPLLTIRRKRLSLGESWVVYDGETAVNPRFTARKQVNLVQTRCLARVSSGGGSGSPTNKVAAYEIEGSYGQRCCAVYDGRRRKVVEIKRKEAVGGVTFGPDVFRLIVQPEIDAAVAMAFVIILDQMFGSSSGRFSSSFN